MNLISTGIIIDDEHDMVETVSDFLKLSGFSIVGTAYNGCDASKLYEQTTPDFVILDMKMPRYDGTYAIKEIKKFNPNAKIFVITGYLEYEHISDQVSAIFNKPCDMNELVKTIHNTLEN